LLQCYDEIKALVGTGNLDRIVPGHDMQLFSRMRSWVDGSNPVAEVYLAPGQKSAQRNG
jgi:hypothetical protein